MQGTKPIKGPARSDRGRQGGPFGHMLAQATSNTEVLLAFASGYETLKSHERRALITVIVTDCVKQEVDPANVLAACLSVETDHGLMQTLAQELLQHYQSPQQPFATFVETGEQEGGEACLVQPLYGPYGESLRIRWQEGRLSEITYHPSIDMRNIDDRNRVDALHAVTTVAPLLWRYLKRGGALPENARQFGHWF